jgi:hypothetical protein
LFADVPGILQGGIPAMAFAKRIRWLLQRGFIHTTTNLEGFRCWWISENGKHIMSSDLHKR